MKTIRIAMCDDNLMEYKILQKALQVAEISAECSYYSCAEDLLNDYHTDRFDLVLLDIYMEGIGGISAAEQLRNTDQLVPIAFITASPDHTMEGFRLHIDRYLQKPLRPDDLKEVCTMALQRQEMRPGLTLKVDGKMQRLPFDSIVYVEQNGHNLFYHMTDGSIPKRTGSLEEMAGILPDCFFHCHKSYIVNCKHITGFDSELGFFVMFGGGHAHIRRSSLKDAKAAYQKYSRCSDPKK
jgi:DNA-binding LytR/AlgR family response regulator